MNQKILQFKREYEKQKISAYKPKHFPGPSVVILSKWNVTEEQKEVLEKDKNRY